MTARFCDLPDGPAAPHVLSPSTAHLMLRRSPFHAHARKLGRLRDETTDEMRAGTLLHALLLGSNRLAPLPFASLHTKAAKQMAAIARGLGFDPVPLFQARRLVDVAEEAFRQAARLGLVLPGDPYRPPPGGEVEKGIAWVEHADDGIEVECCGKVDMLRLDAGTIYDLKTCRSAHPEACQRHAIAYGADIQAAAYLSAVAKVRPELEGRLRFEWVFVEADTGAVTRMTLGGSMRALGEAKWKRAVNTWARCLRTGEWPAYTTAPVVAEAPAWALENEMTEEQDDAAE